MKGLVDDIVRLGLRDAGYQFFNLDGPPLACYLLLARWSCQIEVPRPYACLPRSKGTPARSVVTTCLSRTTLHTTSFRTLVDCAANTRALRTLTSAP